MSLPPHSDHAPIKIAFVIDTLYYPAGGTEAQLFHLLERMDRSRFEPTVFCLHTTTWLDSNDFSLAPLHMLNIRITPDAGLPWKIWKFSRQLRQGGFDIVQTHFRDANIVGVLGAIWAGSHNIVSTRRGTPYWTGAVDLALLRWLNRHATVFLANSHASRERFATEEGYPLDRAEVIYNGLDPQQFAPHDEMTRTAVREELGIPREASVVGIVANLRKIKAIDVFLHAAAATRSDFPQAHFVIVGQGEEESALHELRSSLSLDSCVHFLGPREDVPRLLHAFDIGVLASHSESFSNSILEYLAAGLPVVVTAVGGAREAVRDGHDGFVVPPADALQMAEGLKSLLAHPSGPRAWRTNSEIRRDFHLSTMVEAHETLYSRLSSRTIAKK